MHQNRHTPFSMGQEKQMAAHFKEDCSILNHKGLNADNSASGNRNYFPASYLSQEAKAHLTPVKVMPTNQVTLNFKNRPTCDRIKTKKPANFPVQKNICQPEIINDNFRGRVTSFNVRYQFVAQPIVSRCPDFIKERQRKKRLTTEEDGNGTQNRWGQAGLRNFIVVDEGKKECRKKVHPTIEPKECNYLQPLGENKLKSNNQQYRNSISNNSYKLNLKNIKHCQQPPISQEVPPSLKQLAKRQNNWHDKIPVIPITVSIMFEDQPLRRAKDHCLQSYYKQQGDAWTTDSSQDDSELQMLKQLKIKGLQTSIEMFGKFQ